MQLRNCQRCQENIGNLGARIGVLAILICGIVFLIGLLIGTKDPEYPENPSCLEKPASLS